MSKIKQLIILTIFSLSLYGVEGKITLENGKTYKGTIKARLLHIKDIFRNENVRIRMKQIYSVKLLHESLEQNLEWSSKKEIVVKRHILMVTTRKGKRYWGRLRWRVRLEQNNSERSFVFPTKQILDQKRKNYYAKSLVIDEDIKPPTQQLPYMEGTVSENFRKNIINIFALHYQLGAFFRAGLTKTGYEFHNIFPGTYDFVIVSDKGLVFYLTKPKRQKILDSIVDEYQYGRNLKKWIEERGDLNIRYQVMFYIGHLSDTRVIIMKKDQKQVSYLLWVCKYRKNRQKWIIQNQAQLYSQPMNSKAIPRLFIDQKLGGIHVLFGKKQWNYLIEQRPMRFILLLLLMSIANADLLEQYIFAKDKAFSWEELDKNNNVHKLAFTSQVWQEKSWYHHLYVVLPEGQIKNSTALLWITGSGNGETEIKYATKIAAMSQSAVFILMAVPNQPMFNGLWEDELLAYSMAKTIEKQDTQHLILFPMVKSAIQAMNVAEEFAKNKQLPINSFVVTGASKRGWTTWLTALDSRVKAIVPIVFDFLNIKEQIKNYMDAWGEYGSFVKDYDKAGVFRDIVTEKGTIVTQAIDPHSYRQRILIPKFIILATNDRFSPLVNLNTYYKDLQGKTYVCYVPNNRHRIKSTSRIRNILVAALHHANSGEELPEFSWVFEDKKQKIKIPLKIKGSLNKVNIWHTDAPMGQDFREASWKSFELPKFITSATVTVREGIHRAVFVEAIFKYGNEEVSFCSTVKIFKQAVVHQNENHRKN